MGNLKDIKIDDLELDAMEVNGDDIDGSGLTAMTTASASIAGGIITLTYTKNPPTTATELGCC